MDRIRKRVAVTAAALFAIALIVPGCMKQPLQRPTRALSPTRDPQAVEAAILKALANRGWIAQKERPGSILATLDRRTHQVVARITYSGTGFAVDYVSSTNMDYEKKSGQEQIHRNYNGWVANVIRDTEAYLEGRAPDGGLLQQQG